jgi:hypothetical protein
MDPLRRSPMMRVVSALTAFALGLILFVTTSCTSRQGTNTLNQSGAKNAAAAANAKTDPGIDLNCVYDHLQNPQESFHYVYKKDTSDNDHVDQEADVTPQSIDGFRRDPDGSQQPLHASRSDAQSWQAALAGLTGIAGMSSAIALIHNGSALRREPDGGSVNGCTAIHYSIDTARFDATEQSMLGPTMGVGGFEKGDAWVTSDGCPVKLVLDDEMHKKDGSLLEKVHYEEAMVRK